VELDVGAKHVEVADPVTIPPAPPEDWTLLESELASGQVAKLQLQQDIAALHEAALKVDETLKDMSTKQRVVHRQMPWLALGHRKVTLGALIGFTSDTTLGSQHRKNMFEIMIMAGGAVAMLAMCGCISPAMCCGPRKKGGGAAKAKAKAGAKPQAGAPPSPKSANGSGFVGDVGLSQQSAAKAGKKVFKNAHKGLKDAAVCFGRVGKFVRCCCCTCSPEVALRALAFFAFWSLGAAVLWHFGMIQPFLKQIIVYGWVLVGALAVVILWFMEMVAGIKHLVKKAFKTVDYVHDKIDELLDTMGLSKSVDHNPKRLAGDIDDEMSSDSDEEKTPKREVAPKPKGGWEWLTGSRARTFDAM